MSTPTQFANRSKPCSSSPGLTNLLGTDRTVTMENGKEIASGSREVGTIRKFPCSVCGSGLQRAKIFRNHMKTQHPKKIKCAISRCMSYFDSQEKLKSHIEVEHKGNVLTCQICEHKTISKSSLRKHIVGMHFPKNFPCRECARKGLTKKFASKEYLKKHENYEHKDKVQCNKCLKQFIKWNYKPHVLGKTCDRCHKKFECSTLYKQHRKLCIKCNKCNKTFANTSSLAHHFKRCRGSSNVSATFSCGECGIACTTKEDLETHIRMDHLESVQQDGYICDKCGMKSPTAQGLEAHDIEVHWPEETLYENFGAWYGEN